MEKETQISAFVSRATWELLERQVRATSVKKGYLVEQALRHHLAALERLPADAIVHPKRVVTRDPDLDQRAGPAARKTLRRTTMSTSKRTALLGFFMRASPRRRWRPKARVRRPPSRRRSLPASRPRCSSEVA